MLRCSPLDTDVFGLDFAYFSGNTEGVVLQAARRTPWAFPPVNAQTARHEKCEARSAVLNRETILLVFEKVLQTL